MWSLIPRKLRVFFSKLVGKLNRKCQRESYNFGVRRRDRNRPRSNRPNPDRDLRRSAFRNRYARNTSHFYFRRQRHWEIDILEAQTNRNYIKTHWSRWKRFRHRFGFVIRGWWVSCLNYSFYLNCFTC